MREGSAAESGAWANETLGDREYKMPARTLCKWVDFCFHLTSGVYVFDSVPCRPLPQKVSMQGHSQHPISPKVWSSFIGPNSQSL